MKIDTLHTETTADERNVFSSVVSSVKSIVRRYDPEATIILFGSRARGDYHEESDWDFIILTDFAEQDDATKQAIRREILHEIEFESHDHIATIFHNKNVWQSDYQVTGLFRSIQEEGIVV